MEEVVGFLEVVVIVAVQDMEVEGVEVLEEVVVVVVKQIVVHMLVVVDFQVG